MNNSIFDSQLDAESHDDFLIAELQERLSPLRFDSPPLNFDRFMQDENDAADVALIAPSKHKEFTRRSLPVSAPVMRWLIAASLVIVAGISLWSMREQQPAITDKAVSLRPVATSTREPVRSEPRESINTAARIESPQRVTNNAAKQSDTMPASLHADVTPQRIAHVNRIAHAKRSARSRQPRRVRDTAPPESPVAATEDLLLAIRITGDTLDRTGRQLAARFAAASFAPESKFLRSLNTSATATEETRP